MATFFKRAGLPDYFTPREDVTANMPASLIPSVVQDYEAGRLIHFPNLKFDIDHGFWASLGSDRFAGLKKLAVEVDAARQREIAAAKIAGAGVPADVHPELAWHMASLLGQLRPVYEAIFAGYAFTRRRAVWRLTEQMNRAMHFDTYDVDYPEHFARMFINLDTQPRIWHLSHTVPALAERIGGRLGAAQIAGEPGAFWRHLRYAAFDDENFDEWPRHTAFFAPGDVWVVDSRQVVHQLYYGRRAVSVDFVVARDSMADPEVHYLASARRLRDGLRRAAA